MNYTDRDLASIMVMCMKQAYCFLREEKSFYYKQTKLSKQPVCKIVKHETETSKYFVDLYLRTKEMVKNPDAVYVCDDYEMAENMYVGYIEVITQ